MSTRALRLFVLLVSLMSGLTLIGTTAEARSSYVVTAKASKSWLVLGQAVVFTGSVSPRAAGKPVVLQKRYRLTDPWTTERTATITSTGTFRVGDRPSTLRARWYRIKKPASSTRGAGYSSAFKVLVFKWHYLYDLDEVDSDWFYSKDTLNINGNAYKKSLVSDETGYIEYNLNRKCKTLTATLGLSDESQSGAQANLEILGDGNSLWGRTFSLGESAPVKLTTTNVLRLRIESTDLNNQEEYAAVGSPRVLCRF